MNHIAIYRPSIVTESAKKLAEALAKLGCKSSIENPYNFHYYPALVYGQKYFNYGCGIGYWDTGHKFINKGAAVKKCIDKVETFKTLKGAGVPTVDYRTEGKDVPKTWKEIVCRASKSAARGEGLTYHQQGDKLPNGELFTEYFPHKDEYRFYVFNGKVIGRYWKEYVAKDGEEYHQFVEMYAAGLEKVSKASVKAAKALGIDFVGLDILINKSGEFVILEANSAPMLTDEVAERLAKALIDL